MAHTTCSVSYTRRFRVLSLQIHLQFLAQKNTEISTRVWTSPISSGNRFSNRALKSKQPLNVKITPQKLDFRLEVTNQEFLSHAGGSTGIVYFKMAVAAIVNFEKLLPFLYYWTDPHQIWWECCKFEIERTVSSRNAQLPKFKMAAAAILDFEKLLPFLYYWTNHHQIWWECCESDIERNGQVEKCTITEIQDGGCRHLGFRKAVAISLLFD